MSDLDFNTLLLSWITAYGSPMVAGVLFVAALGVPFPAMLIVIAAGAFVRQNLLDLAVGTGRVGFRRYGCLWIGYLAHCWIQERFGGAASWKKAWVMPLAASGNSSTTLLLNSAALFSAW